jgi:imidazolonepropionase-like amidohydrolase
MPKLRTLLALSLLPLAFACEDPAEQAAQAEVAAIEPLAPKQEQGQPSDVPIQENATFLLHKVERRVGEERVRVQTSPTPEIRTLLAHAERGEQVSLAATLTFGADGLPSRFAMWGKTTSFTEVDIDVTVADGQARIREGAETRTIPAPELYFTAFGYAPIAIKEALIAFWHRHGRPESLSLLPSGTARITKRGDDAFELDGKQIVLERLHVAGMKWGHEVIWIDAQQRLVAVMTNDALYNTMQAVREGYEPLLSEFLARAGADGKTLIDEQAIAPIHEGHYAIVHARLVDGTGAAPVDDAVIVIYDGKIVHAGTGAPPEGVPILDAHGRTVLPGLWDMHAHFEQAEWGPVYLGAGVTTVRDLGNSLSFLSGLRGGKLAPRILCAGLVDGADGNAVGSLIIGTSGDIEPVLTKIEAAGCGQVKVYASLDQALVAPLAKEAHRRGLEVVGHMPRQMKLRDAVNAGFDMVSHIDAILEALVSQSPNGNFGEAFLAVDLEGSHAREVYEFLVEHETVYDPTLAITEFFVLGTANEPGLAKLPSELAGAFATFAATVDPTSPELQMKARFFDKVVAAIGAMHRAGVVIVAGSDGCVAGHSLHRELELYVRAGMSPMAAIQSATSVPARVMGLDREVGTIAPGMVADLILVDGDPLTNISDLRRITTVVTGGRAYETARLWPLAGFKP